MEWIIFEDADRAAVAALNEVTEYKVRPRRIDRPGSAYFDRFAAPGRILDGASGDYWRAHLAGLPRVVAAPDQLFAPTED